MTEHLLDLSAAEVVAQSRRSGWERPGLSVELRRGHPTEKHCALLRLHTPTNEGELLFWVSGEAELAVGSKPEDSYQRHEDGVTVATIGTLMEEVAERVLAAPRVSSGP